MAGRRQQIDDRAAAGVGVLGARVADRDDVAADRVRRGGFVLEIAAIVPGPFADIVACDARRAGCGRSGVINSEIRSTAQRALAQLDRASGYEPGGRRFESCRAHQCFQAVIESASPVCEQL